MLIDADEIVRDLQAPGQPVFEAMVSRWGACVIAADGTLDRGAVAALVFDDDDELAALNAMVHPAVGEEMAARRAELARVSPQAVVVLDIPLLVRPDGEPIAEQYRDLAGIVVVDASAETAVHRLVKHRGLSEDDARARIARQASREQRLAVADFVIDNDGRLEELESQIDACWDWARSRR